MRATIERPRAIPIVRVSRTNGRVEGDDLHSPEAQRRALRKVCETNGWEMLEPVEEMDVSGRLPLARREKLTWAVERVEAGEAEIIVSSYLDRLLRSVRVRQELVERVEDAGGSVHTVDAGEQSNGTPTKKLTGTFMAAVAEYVAETNAERGREGQIDALAEGKCMKTTANIGYLRGPDKRLVPDPATKDIVLGAFQLRAAGCTYEDVRQYMAEQGFLRSHAGVVDMLRNRVYLGEMHFGKLPPRLGAHDAIVPRSLFDTVNDRTAERRGRKSAHPERLLSKQGILRCGSCGSPMNLAHTEQKTGTVTAYYQCSRRTSDCPKRAFVTADEAEREVVTVAKVELAGLFGGASAADDRRELEAALAEAQAALDNAIRFHASTTVVEEMAAARDAAQERLGEVATADGDEVWDALAHWDSTRLVTQRRLLKLVIDRAVVTPGRGLGRIDVQTRV